MPSGFTLLELLTALAIVALLAATSAPAFSALVLDSRRDATVHQLAHAVHSGRRLAASGGETVALCGTRDGRHCSGSRDWSTGLLLISTSGALRRTIAPPNGSTGARIDANRNQVAFDPVARFATTATLTICDRRGAAAARAVIISRSGRPRIDRRDAGGGMLKC